MPSPRPGRAQIALELPGPPARRGSVRLELASLDSPVGKLQLAVSPRGVCALDFAESDGPFRARLAAVRPGAEFETGDAARNAAERLAAYFAGSLHALEGLATDLVGTSFQREVWAALRRIAPGRTLSYGELAASIGRPAAVRAVGGANARNPVALIVPCHRVIAADGTLGGYGGGLGRKAWLLRHEGALGSQLDLI